MLNSKYNANNIDFRNKQNYMTDILIISFMIIASKIINSSSIMYILLIYLSINIIKNDFEYFFYVALILMPSMGVIFAPGLPIPIINILAVVSLISLIIIKKSNIILDKNLTLISFIFIMYEWIHCILYDAYSFISLLTWTCIIIYITIFLSNNRTKYNHEVSIKYFNSGVIVSTIYG